MRLKKLKEKQKRNYFASFLASVNDQASDQRNNNKKKKQNKKRKRQRQFQHAQLKDINIIN